MTQVLINQQKLAEIIGETIQGISGTQASEHVCLASFDGLEISLHVTGDPDQIGGTPVAENIILIMEE